MRQEALDNTAHLNYRFMSVDAKKTAYELHEKDPEYWTAERLAGTFKISPILMLSELKAYEMRVQAERAGEKVDDSLDRLWGEKFGVVDYPNNIPLVPHRRAVRTLPETYIPMDDSISSHHLHKILRKPSAKRFREAPKQPKKWIPKPRPIEQVMPSRCCEKIWPGKKRTKFVMWDISASRDLYTRNILVKELDGSWRTGNWEERQFSHNYRTHLPMNIPPHYSYPDEDQPDNFHPDERAADFIVKFPHPTKDEMQGVETSDEQHEEAETSDDV